MELQSGNKLLNLDTPKIMAILNYTSDSFYDGGKYNTFEKFLERTEQCVKEGADILDIGVASTRPGAELINPHKEWDTIKPLLTELRKLYPDIFISIDTYNSYTAEKCIQYGGDIINDISGGQFDNNMFEVISATKNKIAYVLMHTSDIPQMMQKRTEYNNVVNDVKNFLEQRKQILNNKGFNNIIIDPGFGFGKTISQNYELLKNLHAFKELKLPILAGLSRKSMIYKLLETKVESIDTLFGTITLNTIALMKGANIIRVHDVKEHTIVKRIVNNLL